MHSSPYFMRHIHFVGIGGIGMSGIAEVLHNLGYTITGSDQQDSANVRRLKNLGIAIDVGLHDGSHLKGANTIVVSTAVSKDNPEVLEARQRGIPIIQRGEMLGELMRLKYGVAIAGTHGKTTTTSLMAAVFDAAHMDATVINGGILNAYGTNARLGTGDWIIAEADESDGSFLKLFPTFAVVTNIDADHLDFYKNFEDIKHAFQSFLDRVPFYGAAIICLDDPALQKIVSTLKDGRESHEMTPKRTVTYGLCEGAQIRAMNIQHTLEGMTFDVRVMYGREDTSYTIHQVKIPLHGQHNVQNTLAVIAVALEVGMDPKTILKGLQTFEGVKRRFSKVADVHGMTIVDDYAHHPVEVHATLKAAKDYVALASSSSVSSSDAGHSRQRVIGVLQPHRYSRLSPFLSDFASAMHMCDVAVITPVYEAGEHADDPRWGGVSATTLIQILKDQGKEVHFAQDAHDLTTFLEHHGQEGDLVVCMGAGSITYWAHAISGEFERRYAEQSSHKKVAGRVF